MERCAGGRRAVFVGHHTPPTAWPCPDAPFTFVTEGVASAIEQARRFAGDGDVSVIAGEIGLQAIEVGLVDEVHLDVVPVLFGRGERYFGSFAGAPSMLENAHVVEGDRALHLAYAVRRT